MLQAAAVQERENGVYRANIEPLYIIIQHIDGLRLYQLIYSLEINQLEVKLVLKSRNQGVVLVVVCFGPCYSGLSVLMSAFGGPRLRQPIFVGEWDSRLSIPAEILIQEKFSSRWSRLTK